VKIRLIAAFEKGLAIHVNIEYANDDICLEVEMIAIQFR